jgi:hypothetical protein
MRCSRAAARAPGRRGHSAGQEEGDDGSPGKSGTDGGGFHLMHSSVRWWRSGLRWSPSVRCAPTPRVERGEGKLPLDLNRGSAGGGVHHDGGGNNASMHFGERLAVSTGGGGALHTTLLGVVDVVLVCFYGQEPCWSEGFAEGRFQRLLAKQRGKLQVRPI